MHSTHAFVCTQKPIWDGCNPHKGNMIQKCLKVWPLVLSSVGKPKVYPTQTTRLFEDWKLVFHARTNRDLSALVLGLHLALDEEHGGGFLLIIYSSVQREFLESRECIKEIMHTDESSKQFRAQLMGRRPSETSLCNDDIRDPFSAYLTCPCLHGYAYKHVFVDSKYLCAIWKTHPRVISWVAENYCYN